MKQITISCDQIRTMDEMHDALARKLNFPKWYGRNLDALHDCLSAICEETQLNFLHFSALPFPTAGLLRVLRDSENENALLNVSLITN